MSDQTDARDIDLWATWSIRCGYCSFAVTGFRSEEEARRWFHECHGPSCRNRHQPK